MEAWQQFIIGLIPVILALIGLYGKTRQLKDDNEKLEKDWTARLKKLEAKWTARDEQRVIVIMQLTADLASLRNDHAASQEEIKAILIAQAGLSDKF